LTFKNQPAPLVSALPPALAEAIRLRQAGDAAGALALAEGHASSSEAGAPFLAIAGLAALELGDAGRAIAHLEPLARLRPDDTDIRADFAKALLAAGRDAEALALAEGAQAPDLARIEAWVRQQRGEHGPAIAAYARVLTAQPDDAGKGIHHNEARVLWPGDEQAAIIGAKVQRGIGAPGRWRRALWAGARGLCRHAAGPLRFRPPVLASHAHGGGRIHHGLQTLTHFRSGEMPGGTWR
jgi:tetratricopeptide (TPR) repeat protein